MARRGPGRGAFPCILAVIVGASAWYALAPSGAHVRPHRQRSRDRATDGTVEAAAVATEEECLAGEEDMAGAWGGMGKPSKW